MFVSDPPFRHIDYPVAGIAEPPGKVHILTHMHFRVKPGGFAKCGTPHQEVAAGEIKGVVTLLSGTFTVSQGETGHHQFVAVEKGRRVHSVHETADSGNFRIFEKSNELFQPLRGSDAVGVNEGKKLAAGSP